MYSLEIVLLVSVVTLVVGALIGLVIGRSSGSPAQQKDLEQRLAKVKEEQDAYQQNVAKHFMETSQKVGDLTQSYRDLHEHLAKGALTLASNDIGRDLIEAAGETVDREKLENTQIEPPKDWAPKTPGSHGMLSEEFGLREQDKDHDKETPSTDKQTQGENQGSTEEQTKKAGE